MWRADHFSSTTDESRLESGGRETVIDMKISDLPSFKRPREKLLEKGLDGLSDAELLAILLKSGYRGKNAIEVAETLLSQYTLRELVSLPILFLKKLKGIGVSRSSTLHAAYGIANRLQLEPDLPAVMTPEDVVRVTHFLATKKQEYLVVLYLNARRQILVQETISIGTLDASLVHAREVFAPAFVHRAAQIIIVHNHPSGDPQPSAADLEITERLLSAAEILDIPILDHIIVAKDGWCSLKALKLL